MTQRIFFAAVLSIGIGLLASTPPACATGYWNMPSSFCQCVGCGWGAGHHAPLILGPVTWDGWCDTGLVRVPYPPSPPCAYSGCDGGQQFAEPTMLEPTPAPAAQPVGPVSLRHRPLFLR